MRLVGGIVEHLDLEQFLGILQLDDPFQQPLDDVPLVVQGKLHGHARQFLQALGRRRRELLADLEVAADYLVAVQPVDGEHHHDAEVGDQQRPVKPIELMDSRESVVVQRVHRPLHGRSGEQESHRAQGCKHRGPIQRYLLSRLEAIDYIPARPSVYLLSIGYRRPRRRFQAASFIMATITASTSRATGTSEGVAKIFISAVGRIVASR